MRSWLTGLVDRQQVLVVLGSGGVGKTTLSATLALQSALRGRRTLVLTIDPARRLAQALGLTEFTAERQRVPLEGLLPAGHTVATGELWAMMLDAPRTFDALVARHSSTAEARERILHHRLYRHMVDALAGSHDLAAMEQLHDLIEEERYDLVVLDTPPKEHAFDFLDAPSRLLGLMAQARLRWLLLPMAGLKDDHLGLRHLPTRLILRTLARFTGGDVLRDLATLTLALLDLSRGFAERARRVERLLAGPGSSFLVVTGPDPFTVADALGQRGKLLELGLPFGGFLVNRCQRLPARVPRGEDELAEVAGQAAELCELPGLQGQLEPQQLRTVLLRLGRGLSLLQEMVAQEHRTIERLRQAGQTANPLLEIPELDEEIHSVAQLLRFGGLLMQETHEETLEQGSC